MYPGAYAMPEVMANGAKTPASSSASQSGSKTSSGSTVPGAGVNNPDFQFDLRSITHEDINPQSWIRKGVNFIFERAIAIMAATIGSAAVLMMVIGGFMMLASAGRQEWYDRGKAYVIKSMIGLVFVLGAYAIVTTVQLLVKSLFAG